MGYDADVVIAGAGLNGTALALALASAGVSVVLVDPAKAKAPKANDGRAYALALSSQRLLQALGLWADLAGSAGPILDVTVTDGRAGEGASPLAMELDHALIDEGPMGFMVEDRHLRSALDTRIAGMPNLKHLTSRTVTGHRPDTAGVEVALNRGKALRARVLIGCDGSKSPTADRAGIKRWGWAYGQTSLVTTIGHEKPHNGTAHQFFMPEGPLAVLPLTGSRASIVWTEGHERAKQIQAMDDAGYLDMLRPRIGEFLGEISLVADRFAFPLKLSIARSLVADRTALLGDAAHTVHPIAGQGLNAGLRDVAALAEVLTDAKRRGEDIGRADVLARYERWRRADITALALATDGFNRLFSNDNPILRVGRDLGLGLVTRMPALGRGLIREAAGLTGDLPRLSKGQPL